MNWWQGLRARLLRGTLAHLSQRGVTADGITGLSLAFGLAFWPLLFISQSLALVTLLIHLLLDGLDGPLARHQGTDSRQGSFTDTAVDQLVVTSTTLALIQAHHVDVSAGLLYTFVYAVVVGFAMVRNALDIPYSWVIRPRLLVYAWCLIEFTLWPGSLNTVLWLGTGLLFFKAITGFQKIRATLG